ncbi:hypothetical protein RBQ61_02750 [Sedimentibacter sp. MB35-C1]|uniref:hypothetical protein n=1 Tax=Sedimentibacter sp. MB35-C1 TaxID=3070995 RepID=UPI0027E18428|nr:hypothetical protein [Sedimentibacter sp. MB35-C1]WMJ77864.1 hypothetical protein RBQ61_02750 [Sedimentibacter sp. MB35-C1]
MRKEKLNKKTIIIVMILIFAMIISVFALNEVMQANMAATNTNISPYEYRMVVAYFAYWKSGDSYYADINGVRTNIGEVPYQYFEPDYQFPVALISGNYEVEDIMNYKDYKGSWKDLNYTYLEENDVRNHYMNTAFIENKEAIVGEKNTILTFRASFKPLNPDDAGLAPDPYGRYARKDGNVYYSYIAIVIKYKNLDYVEPPEEPEEPEEPGNGNVMVYVWHKEKGTDKNFADLQKVRTSMGSNLVLSSKSIDGYKCSSSSIKGLSTKNYETSYIDEVVGRHDYSTPDDGYIYVTFYYEEDDSKPSDNWCVPEFDLSTNSARIKMKRSEFDKFLSEENIFFSDVEFSISDMKFGKKDGEEMQGQHGFASWDIYFKYGDRGYDYQRIGLFNKKEKISLNVPRKYFETQNEENTIYRASIEVHAGLNCIGGGFNADQGHTSLYVDIIENIPPEAYYRYATEKTLPDGTNSREYGKVYIGKDIIIDNYCDDPNGLTDIDYVRYVFKNQNNSDQIKSIQLKMMSWGEYELDEADIFNDTSIIFKDAKVNGSLNLQFTANEEWEVTIYVQDMEGLNDSYTEIIKPEVLNLNPTAVIKDTSSYRYPYGKEFNGKQNRVIKLNSNSSYIASWFADMDVSIDHSQDTWQIEALDGQDINSVKFERDVNKYINGNMLNVSYDPLDIKIMFKEAGKYKIRLQVTDTEGNISNWSEQIITIHEDLAPTVTADINPKYYRDSSKNAVITLNSWIESLDSDIPKVKSVGYRYDSDNDGSFDNETLVNLPHEDVNIDTSLYIKIELTISKVGRYQFEITAEEDFGQETIDQYIAESDIRLNEIEKNTEVDNIAPRVSLNTTIEIPSPKINFNFMTVDDNSLTAGDFNSEVNSFINNLTADGLNTEHKTKIFTTALELEPTIKGKIYFKASKLPYDPERLTATNYDYIFEHIGDFGNVLNYSNDTGNLDFNSLEIYVEHLQYVDEDQEYPEEIPKLYYSVDGNNWLPVTLTYNNDYRRFSSTSTGEYTSKAFEFLSDPITSNVRYVKIRGENGRISHKIALVRAYAVGNTQRLVNPELDDNKLLDCLYDFPARESQEKYMVVVTNGQVNINNSLDVISQSIANNVKIIFVGTRSLKQIGENITNSTDGMFFEYDGANIPWEEIEDFINSDLELRNQNGNIILVGDELEYNKGYYDSENDPMYQDQWKYIHDSYYYTNNMGYIEEHNKFTDSPITRFDLVGKYTILYQARDNPVDDYRFDNYRRWSENGTAEIFVHRKPIAEFIVDMQKINSSTFNIILNDTSYDLDHTNRDDKGLVAREWSWKKVGDANWTSGKLTTGDRTKDYIIKLRVRDMDGENNLGVWSDDKAVLITSKAMPPIAQFELSNSVIVQGATLGITDKSYDPNGDAIDQWEWKLYKEGTLLGTYTAANSQTAINNKLKTSGIGNFRITLQVNDVSGTWGEPLATSEIYTQYFKVVTVNQAPTADFDLLSNESPTWTFQKVLGLHTLRYRPTASFFHEEKTKFNVNVTDANSDNLGFIYDWKFERFEVRNISNISGASDNVYTYTKQYPFTNSFKGQGLPWGAYRITLNVTDKPPIPPYTSEDAKTAIVTKSYYIVPELSLVGNFESSNPEIMVGDTIKLKAKTSKETENVYCTFIDESYALSKTNEDGNFAYWEKSIVIPDSVTESNTYNLQFKANTTYGGNGSITREVKDTVPIKIISLKLINFRITDIVNHDNVNFPYTKNDLLTKGLIEYKAGYYVTFRIDSKGKPDNVYGKIDIKNDDIIEQTLNLTKIITGDTETWEGKFYTNSKLDVNTIISIKLDCNKGSTIYDYNLKESWEGRSLITEGSALQDGRVNLTN